MAKEGSTISGFADAFAQAISYALQYGVPLQALVDKFSHVRFEPSGMTRNPEIRFAKSIVDYIFRWMASKFLSPEAQFHAGVNGRELDEARRRRRRRRGPAAAAPVSAAAAAADAVLDDSESGRRAALLDVRLDHDPQRRLLQVRQLREHVGLRVERHEEKTAESAEHAEHDSTRHDEGGSFGTRLCFKTRRSASLASGDGRLTTTAATTRQVEAQRRFSADGRLATMPFLDTSGAQRRSLVVVVTTSRWSESGQS